MPHLFAPFAKSALPRRSNGNPGDEVAVQNHYVRAATLRRTSLDVFVFAPSPRFRPPTPPSARSLPPTRHQPKCAGHPSQPRSVRGHRKLFATRSGSRSVSRDLLFLFTSVRARASAAPKTSRLSGVLTPEAPLVATQPSAFHAVAHQNFDSEARRRQWQYGKLLLTERWVFIWHLFWRTRG